MAFIIYLLYALIQGILFARYTVKEREGPVFVVIMAMIFAPIVTTIFLCQGIEFCITWLVTAGRK